MAGLVFNLLKCILKKSTTKQTGAIMFQRNIGSTERVIRIVAGAAITALAFVGPQTPWALLGLVPLATGLVGWCPPYAIFGINTCKVAPKQDQ